MKRLLMARQSYLIAAALVLGLSVWMLTGVGTSQSSAKPGDSSLTPEAETQVDLTSVRVRRFEAESVQREIVISGRTEPNRSIDVRAETDGRVVALGSERGRPVDEGDVLVRLDLRDRRARLSEAEAAVEHLRLEYEAARKLRDKALNSETRVAQAKAQLESARAAVKRARLDLGHTVIRAPFAGVLQERVVELGDFVDVGNVVARIVDNDPMIVSGELNEQQVGAIQIGDPGQAELVTGQTVEGRVRYIAAEADAATRTFRVELEIPNTQGLLHAGVTTEVRLATEALRAHYLSPALLALNDAGDLGVKAVGEDERVDFYPIRVVRSDVNGIWVTGLPARVRLITVGQGFVRPGDRVRAVDENSAAPALPDRG